MYFESHAHYDDIQFSADREALLASFPKAGIDIVINSGASIASSKAGLLLAERYPFIYAAVGVHPQNADAMREPHMKTLAQLASHKRVVAIGEIGLDYHYDGVLRDAQKYWFRRQLALAKSLSLPVIIHSRDAAKDCFDIIKESGVRRGVIHCYSGSVQMALDYIKLGFYLGIGGVATFQNAKKTLEVVSKVPLSSILIETDAPYLAPVPHRGERNDSKNLFYITEKIAQVKGVSHMEVANITRRNGNYLFFH